MKKITLTFCLLNFSIAIFSQTLEKVQNVLSSGKITGNYCIDAQYYNKDSLIGAEEIDEKVRINALANINYINDKFSAGIRFEMYQNPLVGFSPKLKGQGIAYRYANYNHGDWEVTIGNYYDQFGNGLIFRSYEDRYLGFDNSMDGIRFRATPHKSFTIKGIWGVQRFYWEKGDGIVRGLDAELNINELSPKIQQSDFQSNIGFSFISKYQKDDDPIYILPKNVAAFAGRLNMSYKSFQFNTEYAYKINDPNTTNNMIYKPGEALLLNFSYSKKGLGIILSALHCDNMLFRSDRYISENALSINYLPALPRQHAYTLSAFYPYATQYNGQVSFQGQVNYKFKKNTPLGGKYGTEIAFNYSRSQDIARNQINDSTAINQDGTLGYKSSLFGLGKTLLFQDFNFELAKKITSSTKLIFDYVFLTYNKAVLEGHPDDPIINAHIVIVDLNQKITKTHNLKIELQHLYTKEDDGSWINGMIEYSIAPKWFFSVSDSYNYGNLETNRKIHYYNAAIAFVKDSFRVALQYGKQRKGIICVGGVCRELPASNGFAISITGNF